MSTDAGLRGMHIAALCAEHAIKSSRCRVLYGQVISREPRVLSMPDPGIPEGYAICLHEIGHLLDDRQDGGRLPREIGAWSWAVENALSMFREVVAVSAVESLARYAETP